MPLYCHMCIYIHDKARVHITPLGYSHNGGLLTYIDVTWKQKKRCTIIITSERTLWIVMKCIKSSNSGIEGKEVPFNEEFKVGQPLPSYKLQSSSPLVSIEVSGLIQNNELSSDTQSVVSTVKQLASDAIKK